VEDQGVSPLVAALLTGLIWTVPLPITRLALTTAPIVAGVLELPTVLAIVVALVVWRYGWSRRSLLGGLVGVVAVAVLSEVTVLVDGHDRFRGLFVLGAVGYMVIATFLAWAVGGATGRRLNRRFSWHATAAGSGH
jgi:hypothetical protein